MKPSFFVGVSGFSYAGWKGNFYPKDLKNEEFLSYYSRRLNSVEINSSFYAPPSLAVMKSWAARTGEGFRFAVKSPRQITHISRLGKGAAEGAERLSTSLELLGKKRGPILFQLPPYAKSDLPLLEEFLSKTSSVKQRAFEFRHESWLREPTFSLLDKYGAAFCIADTEDMEPVLKSTGAFAYFRLRKDRYDEKTVDAWSEKITKTVETNGETYVFLRHDETGENANLAQKLFEKLA